MTKRSFTLLELLIVVIILGVLATLGIRSYESAIWRARFAEVYRTTAAIARAEKIYYMANNNYTLNTATQAQLGAGIAAGSTAIQQQLGFSLPSSSFFLYRVYPLDTSANPRIYFRRLPDTWCAYYNYNTSVWTWYNSTTHDAAGPGCKYFPR